ncbi:MAG: hypothetical protein ACM3ZV_04635 [Bacillota bacterium]
MRWRREIDYHGSRSYGAEEPSVPMFRLAFAWLGYIVRRKASAPRPKPLSATVLLRDGRHNFTLLGARPGRAARNTPWSGAVKSGFADNDRRVFP